MTRKKTPYNHVQVCKYRSRSKNSSTRTFEYHSGQNVSIYVLVTLPFILHPSSPCDVEVMNTRNRAVVSQDLLVMNSRLNLPVDLHDGGDVTVRMTVDLLTLVLVMASMLFIICLVLSYRKLLFLQQIRPELSTRKLLILSVALVCVVRIMTILGVATMNIANVRAHYSLQPTDHKGDKNQAFYDKAMTVLLDLPNCMVVSTYMLLTLVWAECCLEARLHNENALAWKRRWLTLYIGFNAILYTAQLILYASIFMAGDRLLRTILYPAITGINFFSVVMVLVLYLYLNVQFSVSQRQ